MTTEPFIEPHIEGPTEKLVSVEVDLDTSYGPSIDPQPRNDGRPYSRSEEDNLPRSRYKLDKASAAQLKSVMEEIERGWRVGKVLFFDVLIIWVVDDAGDVWFAVEELVVGGKPTGHPRHKLLLLREENVDKLGHPSLIFCQKGRIGGQIYFDTDSSPPQWVIDPYSGRYGIHPTRKREHLLNAAKRFSGLGVPVEPDDLYFGSA